MKGLGVQPTAGRPQTSILQESEMERKYAKRKARRVYDHMDKTILYCLDLADTFGEGYELESRGILAIDKLILAAQNMLYRWYTHVWGKAPDAWNVKGQTDAGTEDTG